MQITVKNPCTVDGVRYASGSQTVPDSAGAKLVELGRAINDFPDNPAVPIMGEINPVTGGIRISSGGEDCIGLIDQGRASSNTMLYKPIGTTITPGSQVAQTLAAKFAIPADADSIALVFSHHDTSNALTGVRAVVAATEQFYPAGDNLHPFVAGSERRVLDDATTMYGWRSVTWGGAASPTLAAPSALGNVVGLSNNATEAESDYIALPPDVLASAADIAAGGDPAFRYVLIRIYIPGAAGNKYAFSGYAPSTTKTAANGGWVCKFGQSGGDVVTTAINTSTGAASNWLPVGIKWRSRSKGFGVAFFGDSLMQGQGSVVTAEGMMPWPVRACNRRSGKHRAVAINYGCSGQKLSVFLAVAKAKIPGMYAKVTVMESASTNDGPWTTLLAMQQYTAAALSAVHDFIDTCIANNKIPVVMTFPPVAPSIIASSALGKTIDNERVAHNTRIKALTSALVYDFDAILTDSGSVDAYGVCRIKAALTSDAMHENETASDLLATDFAKLLNSLS